MARNVHWRMRFRSLDDIAYRVDIFEENYEGQPVVLLGGAHPFVTQETEDEDIFLPLRTSSGYLTLVIEDASVVDDILPQRMTDRYVELIDESNNQTKWIGYVSPAQYSNVWNCTPFEMQLPLLSPLAALGDMEYHPLGRWASVGEVLENIFENHLGFLPSSFAFQLLDDHIDSIPFLNQKFSDLRFAKTYDFTSVPVKGNQEGVVMESYTVNDVLDAICRLFGYSIVESPSRYYFAALDTGRKFAVVSGENVQHPTSFTIEECSDLPLPEVVSADGSKNISLGKRSVSLSSELNKEEDIWKTEFLASPIGAQGRWEIPDDKMLSYFGRFRGHNFQAMQYMKRQDMPSAGNEMPLPTPVDILWESWDRDDNEYVGGMFINYQIAKGRVEDRLDSSIFDFPQYKKALLIVSRPSNDDANRLIPAAVITSKKEYSAVNFVKTGLLIGFNFASSDSYRNWDFTFVGGSFLITCQLRWGDYYYRGDPPTGEEANWIYWQQEPCTFGILATTFDRGQAETARAYNINQIVDYGGFSVVVPPVTAASINGEISFTIYTPKKSNIVGIPFIVDSYRSIISDISITAPSIDAQSVADAHDYYRSEYMEMLEGLGDNYEYEQPITHGFFEYSPSGVYEHLHPQDETYWEVNLFNRLKRWYGRAVEQLTIDVHLSDDTPGVRYYRGNGIYLPISRTIDWRDAKTTLTLQKHYEEKT